MKRIGCFTFLCLTFAGSSFAEKITKIECVGCQRIEPETVESYLPVQVGDEYDADAVNEALRALNATGFFESVHIARRGSVLVVTIKEHPIINKIQFEGNSKISDKNIRKAINIKEREVLSPAKIKEVQQAMLGAYLSMGRYNASVNPKVIKLKNNMVNLVFEINEGCSAKIGRIVFVGNEKVSSSELRDVIYSRVKRWYRFFVTDDIYQAEMLEEDKARINSFYHKNGYADAKVLSAVAELSADKKEFVITFAIDEGALYKFGDVKVKSNVAKLKDKDIACNMYCKKGGRYNTSLLEADTIAIGRKVSSMGFPSVTVEPKIVKDQKNRVANLVFNVNESEKVYISKIIIKGNTRTRDHVIRRELPIEEGDVYNQILIRAAESKLRSLGLFKSVNIETMPDPYAADKCIVQIEVGETATGAAMVNVGYAMQKGLVLDLSFRERNFFGSGKSLSVLLNSGRAWAGRGYKVGSDGVEVQTDRESEFKLLNNVNVTAADPHIFDKDIEGTLSGFRFNAGRFESFSMKELGGSVGVAYSLAEGCKQSFDYTASSRDFDDVGFYASPIIKYQTMKKDKKYPGGVSTVRPDSHGISSIRHTISYGTEFLTGLKGHARFSLSTTFAGLGGKAKHLKNEFFSMYSMPIARRSRLHFSFSCGLLSKVGDEEPNIADSFALGLDSFRGFAYGGLGPRAETRRKLPAIGEIAGTPYVRKGPGVFRDFLGGKKFWKCSFETTFPMGLPAELEFNGLVFLDFGTIWDAPEKGKKFIKKTGKWIFVHRNGTVLPPSEKKPDVSKGGYAFEESHCEFDAADGSRVIGHRVMDSGKIRASAGFGISLITPVGPIRLTYAFPFRKEWHDDTRKFLIGFNTTF
jgi:outer membrane protein insertion porin family